MPTTGTIPLQTVINDQLITPALWNGEMANIGTLLDAQGSGGYSATDSQMQIQTNPNPGGVLSHATSMAGELERIRYVIAQITGKTNWTDAIPNGNNLTNVFITGEIKPFGGTAVPTGFLTCDGSAISRTTYATLFAAIGTIWGVGDGSTTFNLPDLRGKSLYGKDSGALFTNVGSSGGTQNHTHTGPAHTHTVNAHAHTISADGSHTHSLVDLGTVGYTSAVGIATDASNFGNQLIGLTSGGGVVAHKRSFLTDDPGAFHSHGGSTGSTTPGTDSQGTGATGVANPPYATVLYIIKT